MKINIESIVKDWGHKFSNLGKKGRVGLYRNYHFYYVGLHIWSAPYFDEYKIVLEFYSLMGYNSHKRNNNPDVNYFYSDDRGMQIDIPFIDHAEQINLLAEKVQEDTKHIFDDIVKFTDVSNRVRAIIGSKAFQLNPNTVTGIEAYQFLFYLACALDGKEEARKILEDIEGFRSQISMDYFVKYYGDFDLWMKGLENSLGEGARLRASADSFQAVAAIKKLPKGKIVL